MALLSKIHSQRPKCNFSCLSPSEKYQITKKTIWINAGVLLFNYALVTGIEVSEALQDKIYFINYFPEKGLLV